MNKSSGFSLLELLIIIVMTAVITAIAVPTFQALVRTHAGDELVSELNLARLTAIRNQGTVTVSFGPLPPNPPLMPNGINNNQAAATWTDSNGTARVRFFNFDNTGEGFFFDPAPPGGGASPVPDNAFFFDSLGFIATAVPNAVGTVYLANRDNDGFFQIQTTLAGGVTLNRWSVDVNNWISVY